MPRSSKTVVLRSAGAIVLVAVTLAGCTDLYLARRDTIAIGAGDAVASNRALQTIDPWPAAAADRSYVYNGDKMRGAAERYRTGKIIEPKGLSTAAGWNRQSTESGGLTEADVGAAKSAK